MTQDEIIRMAREASADGNGDELTGDAIERFAALVAEATKEKAAKVCEEHKGWFGYQIAAAIRSMK